MPLTRTARLMVVLIAALLAVGCGRGNGTTRLDQPQPGQPYRQASLALELIEPATLASGSIELRTVEGAGTLRVEIVANGVSDLDALYFELGYDAQSLSPVRVEVSDSFATRDAHLALSILDQPGRLVHGQTVLRPQTAAGFSGSGVLSTIHFERRPMLKRQTASISPQNDGARTTIEIKDSKTLSWRYFNPGDYDQNGEVNIGDLTPIAVLFGEQATGGFGPNTIEHVVDGDGNGLINITDLTPIGANFGNLVLKYLVFESESLTPYPSSNAAPSTIPPIAIIEMSDAFGDRISDRLRLEFAPDPLRIRHYWVRPTDTHSEGTPSVSIRPPLQWAHTLDGGNDGGDIFGELAVADGAVYAAGASAGDVLLAKFNEAGGLIWARRSDLAGNEGASSISMDGSGGIYIAGTSDNAMLVQRWSEEGELEWSKRYLVGNLGGFHDLSTIRVADDKLFFLGTTTAITNTSRSLVTTCTDLEGTIIWQNYWGAAGGNAFAKDLAVIRSDGVVTGVAVIGSTNLYNAGDIAYLEYSELGTLNVQRTLGTGENEIAENIIRNNSANETYFLGRRTVAGDDDVLFGTLSNGASNQLSRWSMPDVNGGNEFLTDGTGGFFIAGLTLGVTTDFNAFLQHLTSAGPVNDGKFWQTPVDGFNCFFGMVSASWGGIIACGNTAQVGGSFSALTAGPVESIELQWTTRADSQSSPTFITEEVPSFVINIDDSALDEETGDLDALIVSTELP